MRRGLSLRALGAAALVAGALVAPVEVVAPASAGAAASGVLMVVATPATPTAGEVAVRNRLVADGYTVTLADDDTVTVAATAGMALVVVSQSSSSNSAAVRSLAGIAVPVWVAKPFLLPTFGLTTSATTDYGDVAAAPVTVVDPTHPMVAGRSGTVTLQTGARLSWGRAPASAKVAATVSGNATMYSIAKGAALASGAAAPACRLTFPLFTTGPTTFTADAWAMVDATAAWAVAGCPATAAPKGPLLGGWSADYAWYDATIGPATIYRTYDTAFSFPTWQQTDAYVEHGAAREDYSFQLPPAGVAAGTYDAQLSAFLATTPPNLIITNYHEPEQEIANGDFTAAQFRASLVRLAQLVRAQNAADGGTRMVSLILMYDTVYGFKGRNPMDYWPGQDPSGRNWVDVVSFDTYALPHNTETACCPQGYTDGVKWQTAKYLLDPSIAFARSVGSPWMISEFAFLEDVTDPNHKANAIKDFVAYAAANGALAVEYWDAQGGRADWRLRYSSAATAAWRTLVQGG
jgi:hypothetical protein